MAECCAGDEEGSPPAARNLPQPAFTSSMRQVEDFTIGFTCTFTDAPKELRTECPICLYILREPHQATCCGSIYCKLCIERVRSDKKPCPACREASFDVFPDRGLRNSLYGFKVTCVHVDKGCTWLGELRYMEDHLNVKRKPEQRFFGCEYVEEMCGVTCGRCFPRGTLEAHEMKQCSKRPYTCEYCADYSAAFEEVAEKHWPKCPNRSVPCTNECGVYPLNKDLEHHLKFDCDLREPELDTTSPGEIRGHIESTVKSMLTSMAAEYLERAVRGESGGKDEALVLELRNAMEELKRVKEESQKLGAELEKMKLERAEDRTALERLTLEQTEDREAIKQLKVDQTKNREAISCLQLHFTIVPATFTLDGYRSRLTRKERGWTSPYFYTAPHGYRMCLLVDVGGPSGHAEPLFVSVYLSIARGEFDSQLKWPFRGTVTISLLSWDADKTDHVEVIKYHDHTHIASSGRVRGEEISKPWGKGKFIRHDRLEQGGFVANDQLKFQVSKVDLDVL